MTQAQEIPTLSRAAAQHYENVSGLTGLFDIIQERGRVRIIEEEEKGEKA